MGKKKRKPTEDMQKIKLITERRKEIPKTKQYIKSSISSVIREMQIKMTAIHYLIKNTKSNKTKWQYGKRNTAHSSWEV